MIWASDHELLGRALAGCLRTRDERRLADLLREAGWIVGNDWPEEIWLSGNGGPTRMPRDSTWRDPVTGVRSGLWGAGVVLAERELARCGWAVDRPRYRAPGSAWWVGSIVAARLAFGFAVAAPKKGQARPSRNEPLLDVAAE
jgi:hypothetical protein